MKKSTDKLREVDLGKLELFGKLKNSEDDLSKVEFISKEKSKSIFRVFSTVK